MSECEFRTTQQTSKGESGTTQADIEVRVLHRSAEVGKRVLAHFAGDIALFVTQFIQGGHLGDPRWLHSSWSLRRPLSRLTGLISPLKHKTGILTVKECFYHLSISIPTESACPGGQVENQLKSRGAELSDYTTPKK